MPEDRDKQLEHHKKVYQKAIRELDYHLKKMKEIVADLEELEDWGGS